MLVIYRGRFALSASFYLHFTYLSKQHKCNAFPKQTKVEKGMDRYRALPLLTCGCNFRSVFENFAIKTIRMLKTCTNMMSNVAAWFPDC